MHVGLLTIIVIIKIPGNKQTGRNAALIRKTLNRVVVLRNGITSWFFSQETKKVKSRWVQP